ncbi:MAG: TetR family transcriptional regulator [Acidobacteria bacterium]|nr:TetR family transcriptional regulator [Acidobacteriota bacterium]MBS1867240.1 TetR family transcriptional regulator [Acidobacteriota bacterium]
MAASSNLANRQSDDRASSASRRERRSAEIRDRLFRSSLRLFAQKGFAETTVEDITEAADVGKGTFFNYFPSKDHVLLAFSDMQLAKLEESVEHFRNTDQPLHEFLQSLTVRMTEEPLRNPGLIRALLLGYLSSNAVREVMTEKQMRALALHTKMVEIAQSRGELRTDIPAIEIANVFRQTIFGTLLMWSLTGDATLRERIRSALHLVWSGIAPANLEAKAREQHWKEEVR